MTVIADTPESLLQDESWPKQPYIHQLHHRRWNVAGFGNPRLF